MLDHAAGEHLGVRGHALGLIGNLVAGAVDLEQRVVQGVQDLVHGLLDGNEFSFVITADGDVHLSLRHVSQAGVNIGYVLFKLISGLVDRVDQHADLRSVGLKGERGGEVAVGDLAHLVTDRNNRTYDLFLSHQENADLHKAYQQNSDGDDHAYHVLGSGQGIDLGLGPGLQGVEKLLFQSVYLADDRAVLGPVHVAQGSVDLPALHLVHGFLLQGD